VGGADGASNGSRHRTAPESAPSRQPARAPERPAAAHTDRGASRGAHGDYTVRTGDTLSGIAQRHGTSWRRLYSANKDVIGADPDVIVPGQRLAL
jgi:nucleoid-associated protein YgaU